MSSFFNMATRASARLVKNSPFVGKNAFISSVARRPLGPCSSRCLSTNCQRKPTTDKRLLTNRIKTPLTASYESARQSLSGVSGLLYRHNSRHRSSASSLNTKEEEEDEEITMDQEEGAFDKFGISETVQQKLRARGISYLFPVQYKAYEHSMEGKDVIIQARTGTGKTLSFAIPLVEKLLKAERRPGRNPKVLVLTPTRELANQIKEDFAKLSKNLSVVGLYGGVPYGQQQSALNYGTDVVVGTPGRINDLIQKGYFKLGNIAHVVLDEVDSMLDFGFKEQVEEIISSCYGKAAKPQTMLYSATMPPWVIQTAKKYLSNDYQHLNFVSHNSVKTATTIEQYAVQCYQSEHEMLIQTLLNQFTGSEGRAIVFCEMKREVDRLAQGMLRRISRGLHGDKSQRERENTLQAFKRNHFRILITTSVAARGLDIPDVPLVIQTSPPNNSEHYIHRVGRTGRAGKSGVAVCFYESSQWRDIKELEQIANKTFKQLPKLSGEEVLNQAMKSSIQKLGGVSEDILDICRETAEKIVQEKGPVDALAAALALIGNINSIYNSSLINGSSGYRTVQFRSEFGETTIRYLKSKLYEVLDEDDLGSMEYTKNKEAIVFDVKSKQVSQLVKELEAAEGKDTVKILTELPDLESSDLSPAKFSSGGRDYRSQGFKQRSYDEGFRGRSMDDRFKRRSNEYTFRSSGMDNGFGSRKDNFSKRPNIFDKISQPYASRGSGGFGNKRSSFASRPNFNEDFDD